MSEAMVLPAAHRMIVDRESLIWALRSPQLATLKAMGAIARKHRRQSALTLDELATLTTISKPYLSLFETGRVSNPPSDDKLSRIEQCVGLPKGCLVALATVLRTPSAVRSLLAEFPICQPEAHL